MSSQVSSLPLHVLVYQEQGKSVAHALEMDLVGTGGSEKEAFDALCEAIECQLSFAIEEKNMALLVHPAPENYWQMWKRAQEQEFASVLQSGHRKPDRQARMMAMPSRRSSAQRRFSLVPNGA